MSLTSNNEEASSMKGSSPDTFGYRDPQKAHNIAAAQDFHSFSLTWLETTASKVQYITLKHKTGLAEGNKRKEERPEICDINPKELTCFQMCLIPIGLSYHVLKHHSYS